MHHLVENNKQHTNDDRTSANTAASEYQGDDPPDGRQSSNPRQHCRGARGCGVYDVGGVFAQTKRR